MVDSSSKRLPVFVPLDPHAQASGAVAASPPLVSLQPLSDFEFSRAAQPGRSSGDANYLEQCPYHRNEELFLLHSGGGFDIACGANETRVQMAIWLKAKGFGGFREVWGASGRGQVIDRWAMFDGYGEDTKWWGSAKIFEILVFC